ncbi:MAG: lysine transporter LysE [Flavobacterium psychrophilum]|nr:MAG: lysine transporter LysE [Flavobacterium psychrophilum]
MGLIVPVGLGFLVSFVATLLPGLLNMTAAKISLREGRANARFFSFGAALILFVQAYIAVTFAKLINRSPDILLNIQEAGVCIFGILTVYFLFFAKTKKKEDDDESERLSKRRSKTGNFFLGALISALNFFAIPYYVFLGVSFSASKVFEFTNLPIFLFVLGASLGAYTVFYIYIAFFRRFEHKTDFLMRNVNYLIGTITGVIAIITLIKMLRN